MKQEHHADQRDQQQSRHGVHHVHVGQQLDLLPHAATDHQVPGGAGRPAQGQQVAAQPLGMGGQHAGGQAGERRVHAVDLGPSRRQVEPAQEGQDLGQRADDDHGDRSRRLPLADRLVRLRLQGAGCLYSQCFFT